jgi:hypothetical protein
LEKGAFVGGRSERAIDTREKALGEGILGRKVEEKGEHLVTSIVEDACAPTLRAPSALGLVDYARTRRDDDVKARVAMRRDRQRASEQEVVPPR